MKANFKEEILCQGSNFRLEGLVHMGGLYLKLNISQQGQKTRKFQARLNSLRDQPQLQKWFDQIQELLTHLKSPNNIKIDIANKKLTILISATKNTIKHVPIGELTLNQIDVLETEILQQVIFQCKKDRQASSSQLKKMILTLSQILMPVLMREKGGYRSPSPIQFSMGPLIQRSDFSQQQSNRNKIDELQLEYDRRLQELHLKIQVINQSIQQLNERLKQQQQSTRIEKRMSGKQKMSKSLLELIDPICKDFDVLKIQNSLITVQGGLWGAYIFGKKKIKNRNTFSIKVVKVQKFIAIGIGNQDLRNQQIKGSDNHFLYDNLKKLYGPGVVLFDQGRGFKRGDVVTVVVHQNSGEILWKVNNQIKFTYSNEKIGQYGLEWVPLIQLPNDGDCIQWIE